MPSKNRRITMAANKHFTLLERIEIEHYLNDSYSFKAICRELNRDCTTIAKEVKKHISLRKTGAYGKAFNNCLYRHDCRHSYLCDNPACRNRYCRFCSMCSSVCKDYKEDKCSKLLRPPYVCNGCDNLKNCRLEKSVYSAATAQKEYETLRCESRSGIIIDEAEAKRLDDFISPLIKKGQSIHHICSNNIDAIMCSEKTIYNYVDFNLFSARNLDLPRKVRYRPRKKSASSFKVDKSCRIGRTYEDFLAYMYENLDTPVVEMDSVEGIKGGKVLLTIHFREPQFMLAFLRDANTSRSVINIFEKLYWELNPDVFNKLFPVILTDNGSEFSNPSVIEFDSQGNRRTRIFYCDPSAPYQKGAAENNHELIRRIVPKGCSFNNCIQDDINLMMNHINSYGRKKLSNQSPHQVFSFLHGFDTLKKLGAILIPTNEVTLKPELLKK
jgi:IS30 family transposase